VTAQEAEKFFPDSELMTVGIYYYPEHWNPLQWERDRVLKPAGVVV
jgi:beta-galactosidase